MPKECQKNDMLRRVRRLKPTYGISQACLPSPNHDRVPERVAVLYCTRNLGTGDYVLHLLICCLEQGLQCAHSLQPIEP